jgi:DNA-directed RNA polymerase specialized sigma24 family protein
MGGATEFCRHPGDLEGCIACLIGAYRAGTLEEHRIMIGLQHGHPQCLQVLARNVLTGPVPKPQAQGSREPGAALPPSLLACQMALHLGYQRDLPGAKGAFVQAYQALVGSKLRGYPQADANDIFQEVFLAMEKRLRNPAPINGMLSAYIGTVTDNAIRRFLGKKSKQGRIRADADLAADVVDEMPEGYEDIPMGLAELWEDCDRILASSKKADFVDRVIFAQGFVCSGEADRIPTKNILRLWRSLAESDKEQQARHLLRTSHGMTPLS